MNNDKPLPTQMDITSSTRNTSYPAIHTTDTSSYILHTQEKEKEIDSFRPPTNPNHSISTSFHSPPNYLNEMKTEFDHTQHQLSHKAFALQNELTSTSQYLNDKISSYETAITQLNAKHNHNMNLLMSQLHSKLTQDIAAKDEEILILTTKHNELSQCNDDLNEKLNQYSNVLNTTKSKYDEHISLLENENDSLENEYMKLKRYYEHQIETFQQQIEDEKNGIRCKYDNIKKQLQDEYNETKEYYNKIMLQKEIDAKGINMQIKKDNEKLILENRVIKDKMQKLMDVNYELTNEYNDKKHQIQQLRNEIQRIQHENAFYINEKTKYENDYYTLNKQHNVLQHREAKLNRITNGKLSKKK